MCMNGVCRCATNKGKSDAVRVHHKEALCNQTMSLQQDNDPKIRHKVAQNGVIKTIKVCKAQAVLVGSLSLRF